MDIIVLPLSSMNKVWQTSESTSLSWTHQENKCRGSDRQLSPKNPFSIVTQVYSKKLSPFQSRFRHLIYRNSLWLPYFSSSSFWQVTLPATPTCTLVADYGKDVTRAGLRLRLDRDRITFAPVGGCIHEYISCTQNKHYIHANTQGVIECLASWNC